MSAELIDVSDNAHLWGEQFNRQSGDILSVQDEIARKISQKLRAQPGDKEQAFQWLKRSYEERSYQVFFIKVKPAWTGMRSDPRYVAMLRSIGLEQ